jgi:hypothetical protein
MVSTKETVGGVRRSSEELCLSPREIPIEEFGLCCPATAAAAEPGFLLEDEAETDGRGGSAELDSFFDDFSEKWSCWKERPGDGFLS